MVSELPKKFNEQFTQANYQQYLAELNAIFPTHLEFRVAETPLFIGKDFKNQILSACEHIVDVIKRDDFLELTNQSIPENCKVKGKEDIPSFIAFDFGICENADGTLSPQLIEMQGFPTLFAFQAFQDQIARKHFEIPDNFSCYLNDLNTDSYLLLLKEIILGNYLPQNVILLEVLPHTQKTRIDFYFTEKYLGIKPVCVTELIKEGNQLFYLNNGVKTQIHRIYNRLIFDDLQKQTADIQEKGKILLEDLDVEWIPHPNWFYRVSKYTLPFLNHPSVPETRFLIEIKTLPTDLENYVLKPLFSFSGQGVVIDVTQQDIENVTDPHNWILQRKVKYAEAIDTINTPAKAEIRIFYFWKPGAVRPIAVNNLSRLSKGKMIGVRYNQNNDWVGGTIAYFEK